MGKRSNFDRIPRDFYPTPLEAVTPLVPHLPGWFTYVEPCAGDGALVDHLASFGFECASASDIEPQCESVSSADALTVVDDLRADYTITNPPWNRKILHPMIDRFANLRPTWLLFDADWMHTKQSAPFMHMLVKVVSVGRVKWIPDSKMTGKDNCAWHLFDAKHTGPTRFYGRATQ